MANRMVANRYDLLADALDAACGVIEDSLIYPDQTPGMRLRLLQSRGVLQDYRIRVRLWADDEGEGV